MNAAEVLNGSLPNVSKLLHTQTDNMVDPYIVCVRLVQKYRLFLEFFEYVLKCTD